MKVSFDKKTENLVLNLNSQEADVILNSIGAASTANDDNKLNYTLQYGASKSKIRKIYRELLEKYQYLCIEKYGPSNPLTAERLIQIETMIRKLGNTDIQCQ